MKKILHTLAFVSLGFFAVSVSQVSAQEIIQDNSWNNYTPTYNGNTDFVSTTCVGCNVPSTYVPSATDNSWNNYTPTYNGNTDFVSTTCAGCTSPTTSGVSYSSSYIPPTVSSDNGYTYSSTYVPPTAVSPIIQNVDSMYAIPVSTNGYTYGGYGYPAVYGSNGYTYGGYGSATTGNYGYMYGGYNNNNTTSCPSGSSLINGTCQVNNVYCPSGSSLINGVCTVTNVNTNYTCWNGNVVAYSSLCPVNYSTTNYTQPTVYYNGSSYYGNSNYYNNNQPIIRYPVITPVQTVKFNNVVTSVVTQITNTSGRCNGIGLIANGSPSTGWFEYGETPSLGRTTGSAQIGTSSTAPFSNVLANLKPNTRYYCRAVMQNEFGIVKGEIVSFITKSKVTTYVQPVTTVKKVITKKVVVTKKPELVCLDWGYKTVSNGTSGTSILTQGEKLMNLQIEKSEGKLSANSLVSYKIVYKNLSDARLNGVVVKISIPSEVKFSLATAGIYDESTHTLTVNQDTLDAHYEGVVAISGRIIEDAPVGKSIVTTAYVVYTVPGTQVQDEVTAYVVGSIVPTDDISKFNTGAKNVIGNSGEHGFMPNNLVEWLALIAIIFIIFILGRSIYVSYKEDEEGGH